MSVRALRDLEHGRARAAQQRSAAILADALGLHGSDREEFLGAARAGRRRAMSPPATAVSWLPSPVELVGRVEELARLRVTAAGGAGTVVVVGPPGVGKTALAVFAANEMRSMYADGCISVDLRGMDDHPLTVAEALERLLRGLGVPESEIPGSEEDRAGLYRAALAGRQVLVLLDNGADEGQVRPLLAGSSGCLTLVTCRRALAGLEDVRWVWLEPLAAPRAVELLAGIVGEDRVHGEPEAAAELVALCGNLPLAVRIASNRLASRPHWSMAYLVEQLRDERVRLNALSVGDLQVRSAFEVSYRRLSSGARLVFRRLAAVPGADFGSGLAGVVIGLTQVDVLRVLDELVDAGLLQATQTDGRFQYHDLIRIFAGERWEAEDTPADYAEVSDAVLGYLLRSASAAGSLLSPQEDQLAELEGVFASEDAAAQWFAEEESNWVAALRVATSRGWHREVLEATAHLRDFADNKWMGLPWATIFQLGLDAARALADRPAEAKLLNLLAWAQVRVLGDTEGSLATFRQALAVAVETGDRYEEIWSRANLGGVFRKNGDLVRALAYTRAASELSADGSGSWFQRASVEYQLGHVLEAMGRYEEALSVHRAVLADAANYAGAKCIAWRHTAACLTMGVGSCLDSVGDWRSAAETFGKARGMYLDARSAANAGEAALKEGRAWRSAGEHSLARECFHDALTLYGSPAPQRSTAEVLAELARLPEE